jgi:hypothetical protein
LHDPPAASGEPEHPSLCIEKGDEATMLVKSIEADLELFVTVIVCGALVRKTMTLPKSCLSGVILRVPAESDRFDSGAGAAFATLYATSSVTAASNTISTHTAQRRELNVNMKIPPRSN